MKEVYLDYSATTPVKKEVLDAMLPFLTKRMEIHRVYIIKADKQKLQFLMLEKKLLI